MVKFLLLFSVIGVFNYSCAQPQRYINQGLFGQAEKYCYSLEGQKQKDCFFKVGKALYEKEKFIHASDLYQKAGALEMENQCYLALALKAVKKEDFAYAGKWYLKARKPELAGKYFEKEAQKLIKKGKLRAAAEYFKRAGKQAEFKKTILLVGKKMEKKNNFHSALNYYKTAGIEMKPIYKRFARHYLKYGKIHESMKCFDLAGFEPEQYYKIIAKYFLQKRAFHYALSYFLKAGISKKKSFRIIAQSALRRNLRSKAEIYYGYSGMPKSEIQLKLAKYCREHKRFYLAGEYYLKANKRNRAISMFQKVLKNSKNLQNSAIALIKLVKLQDQKTIVELARYAKSKNKRIAGAARFYYKITNNKKLNTAIIVYPPFGRKMNSEKWEKIIKLPGINTTKIIKKFPVLSRGKKKYFKIKSGKKHLHKYFHRDSKWLQKAKNAGKYDLIIEIFIKKDLVPPIKLNRKVIEAKSRLKKQPTQQKSNNSKYYGNSIRANYLQLIKVHIPALFMKKSFQTSLNYKGYPFIKKKDLSKLQTRIKAQWKRKNKTLQNQLLNLFKDIIAL